MSRSLAPAIRPRLAGILVCALALAACHHRSPGGAPAAADPLPPAVPAAGDPAGARVARVEELLKALPGVSVRAAPDGRYAVRVRGALGAPLYVVDGMAVDGAVGRGLDWLQPSDVTRIAVLTDLAETAMYGPRGANGVIVITTRRARSP